MRRHTGSVLPKIAVTRVADGFRIFAEREKTTDDVKSVVIIGLFFPVWVAIAILNNVDPLVFVMNILPFVVIVIFAVIKLHAYNKRRGLFGDSHLDFASWPIRLGEDVSMKFRKHTRAPMEVTLVSARIECVELVTTGSGKYQSEGREQRWRQDLDESDWSQSDASGSWSLTMPAHESASVEVHRMKLDWVVTVITSGRGVEKTSEFRLLVIPEVAE